ncbi:SDR family oxidoreductase [Streptomyces sp. NPDC015661]|uniref:SDR family oxidoreductase n=1 Tax=Streptomyces sp. NPDC015661 TaxID=3364961 RepID=UPI0036FCAFBD
MSTDLRGEVAVVTGAAGKLGRLWSQTLLAAGAHVVGLDLDETPPKDVQEVADREGSGDYAAVWADVTHRPSLEQSLRWCQERFGTPTILINNAGIDQPPSSRVGNFLFEDVPEELSAMTLDVNALGALRVCQVFGSVMAAQGHGAIVNIGSLYGNVAPFPPLYDHLAGDPPFLKPPAYGMSKAGIGALSRYLAALWGPRGVRVNTLSPGGVLGDQDPQFRAKFTDRVPMGRMAQPEDLSGPLLFLVSAQSSYVTGQELLVDGGYTCW